MFLRKGKPQPPSEDEPLVPPNGAAEMETPAEDSADGKDPLVTQITSLEELVSKRTRDLEEAKKQLSELHEATGIPDEEDDSDDLPISELFVQPNQMKGEPPAAAAVEPPVVLTDTEPLPEKATVAEGKPEDSAANEAMSGFFSSDEEEENPLTGLIDSLPEVTAEELVEEARQVTAMLREWHEKQQAG